MCLRGAYVCAENSRRRGRNCSPLPWHYPPPHREIDEYDTKHADDEGAKKIKGTRASPSLVLDAAAAVSPRRASPVALVRVADYKKTSLVHAMGIFERFLEGLMEENAMQADDDGADVGDALCLCGRAASQEEGEMCVCECASGTNVSAVALMLYPTPCRGRDDGGGGKRLVDPQLSR